MAPTEEKPFTKLFRESGLMDKYVTEFERWRLIDPQDDKPAGPQKTLGEMIDDIAELLDKEPEMQQTRLTPLVVRKPPACFYCRAIDENFYAVRDEIGRLVVEPHFELERGHAITEFEGDSYVIEDVEKLYEGQEVTALLLTIHQAE